MLNFFIILAVCLGLLAIYMVNVAIRKIHLQKKFFRQAVAKAKITGKPLLIIGCPHSGIWNKIIKTYSHGDICLDIDGCKHCKFYDINKDFLKNFPDDSYVIFESGTLCFSNNLAEVTKQVLRVSGGDCYLCGSDCGVFYQHIGRFLYEKFCPNKIIQTLYPYKPEDENIRYYCFILKRIKSINIQK